MKPSLLAVCILMAAPLAHAQPSSRAPDPADPAAAVPQPVYESALSAYIRAPQENGMTPDKTWRQANEAVAAGPAHTAHDAAPPSAPTHKHHHRDDTPAKARQ